MNMIKNGERGFNKRVLDLSLASINNGSALSLCKNESILVHGKEW